MKLKWILLIVLSFAFCVPAQAQVTLSVSKKSAQKIRAAVPSFETAGDAALAAELKEILVNDLQVSGYFSLWGDSVSVEETAQQDRIAGRVFFAGWKQKGVELLVTGKMRLAGEEIQLECAAYSINEGSLFFQKNYARARAEKRELMHQVSDDILQKVTGEKGLGSSQIAFVANRLGAQQIYKVNWDGRNLVQLTNGSGIALYPRWSPDKTNILCTDYSTGAPAIAVLNLKRNTQSILSNRPGLNAFARYSPDGKNIALTLSLDGNPEIYRCRADGRDLRRLTRTRSVESSPCWTPDGRHIIYVSDRSGTPQLYRMRSDGSDDERLTFSGSYNTSPEVSPNGRLLAYCTLRGNGFQLTLMDLQTKQTVPLLADARSNEDPSWGPSGRHLAYSGSEGQESDIYIIDIYDPHPLRLTKNLGKCSSPSWSQSFKLTK